MNKLNKNISGRNRVKDKIPHGLTKRHNAPLFDRVVSILEEARSNVVRAINNSMVIAYWLIGREIVQEMQGGEDRAKYGEKVIEQLSSQLKEKYGRGFSISNLRYFRTFYTVYSNRKPEIRQIRSGELVESSEGRIPNEELRGQPLKCEKIGIKDAVQFLKMNSDELDDFFPEGSDEPMNSVIS